MELAPLLLSLLFFVTFAVYLFYGIYVIHLNKHDNLNRVFFLLCVSFSVHSLGIAIANSAPNILSCLFWNKFAFIGYASVYGLFLHFTLILTGTLRKGDRVGIAYLLYLPTMILIFAFSLPSDFSSSLYNLQSVGSGCTYTLSKGIWPLLFETYQLLYVLLGLSLLWRWGVSSQDKEIKRQAQILILSTVIAFLPPRFVDAYLITLLVHPIPTLSPVFPLLILAGLHILMSRYGLMRSSLEDEDEFFLEGLTNSRLAFCLATAFITGGITCSLAYFFPCAIQSGLAMRLMLLAGIIFFILGFMTLSTQFIKNLKVRRNALLLIMLISIPALTWQFIEFAAITIWAFPIVIMLVTLLFTSRVPLILVATVAIATQIPVMLNAPVGPVIMDTFDYAARVSIFMVTLFVGMLVNKTYTGKMKESELQARSQKLISEISTELVSVSLSNVDRKIHSLLEKIALFFMADRTGVFLFDAEKQGLLYSYEWHTDGIPPAAEHEKELQMQLPWVVEQLTKKPFIFTRDTSTISDEFATERERFIRQGVKSAAAVAIEENGELIGFIGLQCVEENKDWSGTHSDHLAILSNLFADGFIRIRSEKEIETMAYYDQLTGLPNRTLFSDRLAQALHLAKRNNRLVGVVLMDLDSFKMINDTLGHSGGDEVLKEVARSLQQRLRKSDTVARFGGDEFLILLNDIGDYESVASATEDIMELFIHPFYVQGQNFFLSGSAGAAVFPHDGTDEETLLKNADVAMYIAKSRGKDQFVLCTEDMKDEVRRTLELSNELYGVQDRDELVIHYQPQISLMTGEIVGIEALVRWNHPRIGIIPPNVFIPLAEMNGTINAIGDWILRTAIGQRKWWLLSAPSNMRVSVNLSVVQLYNHHFVDNLAVMLKETRLDPKFLELEIKECAAVRETELILETMKKLKQLGVSLSVDDFGTECSSLSRLKVLPIDRIKIDMPFVQGTENDAKDRTITTTIINLAKGLGMEVMAEGVESESQMSYLRQEKCDDAQGFFYGGPMPADEIEKRFFKRT